MINTFFIGQLGDEAEIDRLELKVNWRMKHEFGETFALGVGGDGEIEDLAYAGTFEDQKHRLGPFAYLSSAGASLNGSSPPAPYLDFRKRHLTYGCPLCAITGSPSIPVQGQCQPC